MLNDFYEHFNKFSFFSDRATDWLIKSWKFKHGSDEWLICRLRRRIYWKKAIEHLKEANKILKKYVQN